MKFSVFKEIIVPMLSLLIICLVCSALLAYTNGATKDAIMQRSVEAESNSKTAVVPEAKDFSDSKSVSVSGTEYPYYEALDDSGKVIAYVFTTTSKGYGGDVRVMTGISKDGKITGVTPLTLNETPGLGMKAQNEDFLSQYIGKSDNIGVNKNSPGDNEIQAITGATITSRAVTACVNSAFEIFNGIKEANGNG